MGTVCRLCLRERELRRSHVIPEFCYKLVYDEKHRFFVYSTDPQELPSRPQQKGFREKLLCDDCEQRFSPWEKYTREVFYGGSELEGRFDPQEGLTIRGADYKKLKLFGMSILWRAGVSSLSHFSAVELGPHGDRLRERLLQEDAGAHWDYGYFIMVPPDREAQEIFSQAIIVPEALRFNAHRVYRFMLGMTFWLFPVASHMQRLEAEGCHFSLFEDGTLKVYNGGRQAMNYVERLSVELAKAEQSHSTEP